jgi:hypothetical protein
MRLAGLILTCFLLTASAPSVLLNSLTPLQSAVAPLRTTRGANREFDAGPELAAVKDKLRRWVEAQLPRPYGESSQGTLQGPPDYGALARRLTGELDAAGLTCGLAQAAAYPCASTGEEDDRGYLGAVRIGTTLEERYLFVVTAVGVRCGYDESAYLYEYREGSGWTRLLSIEEADYGARYTPRDFVSLDVFPSDKAWNEAAPPPLVAALTTVPSCASNWHSMRTRLWRATAASQTPAALIDRADTLYMGDYFIAAERLTGNDFLVEFNGDYADEGVLIRHHVVHYRLGADDRPERIGPVALAPEAFVDEWMKTPWSEARRWTETGARAAAARVHARFAGFLFGDFEEAKRCRLDANLWQVGFTRTVDGKSLPPVFFEVRWTAPYRFALVGAASRPRAHCDLGEAMPDDIGTLFPLQGWRGD